MSEVLDQYHEPQGLLNLAEYITPDKLDKFLKEFRLRAKRKATKKVTKSKDGTSGFAFQEFRELFSSVTGFAQEDEAIVVLCKKMDAEEEGFINEHKFMTYLLQQFRERDAMANSQPLPFQETISFKINVFSKQTPCRLLQVNNPPRLVSISKDGVITTWSTTLELLKGTVMDDKATDIDRAQLTRMKRSNLWVTDMAVMSQCNVLVVSTTSREFDFYDISTTVYKCQYRLCDIPKVPLCMTCYTDTSKPNNPVTLMYGDEAGSITMFQFLNPLNSLFVSMKKDRVSRDNVQLILYSNLPEHSSCIRTKQLLRVHSDWVRKIMYLPYNHSFISCSTCPTCSLVMRDVEEKRKPYIFRLMKGVLSFDYCQEIDVLATGSADHLVRLWDPYVTNKPMAILNNHSSPVLDILIHKKLGLVYTFSSDLMLCAWDIREHSLMQMVTVKFPFSQRQPDFAATVLSILPYSTTLTLTCNEYIAIYRLGSGRSSSSTLLTTSHPQPVTAALYDSYLHQVVSGCEGGEVNVWDITTGAKVLRFKDCHGLEEITSMSMDALGKRLITASRAGNVKVWNYMNGECLKCMQTPGNAEVTGLIHVLERSQFLAMGWNRRITSFPDEPDVFTVKSDGCWSGPNHHKDDIISTAFCPPNLLATGSFDGEIIVWNTDSERLLTRLKALAKMKQTFDMHPSRKRSLSATSSHSRSGLFSHRSSTSSFSRPASRRLSSYQNRSNSFGPCMQHVPVDKLLFLRSRVRSRQKGKAILISSEAGCASFWDVSGSKESKGTFPLTAFEDQIILALSTDPSNQFLLAGDTAGYVSLFDINSFCTGFAKVEATPSPLVTWQAHTEEILSVELVMDETQSLALTSSADCSVRLWTLRGQYIGTFGQESHWNLSNPATFQHPKTPWGQLKTPLHTPTPLGSSPAFSGNPSQPGSVTEDGALNKVTTASFDEQPGLASIQAINLVVNNSTSSISSLGKSSKSCKSNGNTELPPIFSNTLGGPYKDLALRRMADKSERRQQYSKVDVKSTERFGTICSPFQALHLLQLDDEKLPVDIQGKDSSQQQKIKF